ncbi:hypothetical protein AKO1_004323 [Acrasis kona]|uniref:ATP synthase protein MI25 n=1 Tax=Acrasis kona TaxID=1008807 RepID=A0AAW2Z5K8_9EUKA
MISNTNTIVQDGTYKIMEQTKSVMKVGMDGTSVMIGEVNTTVSGSITNARTLVQTSISDTSTIVNNTKKNLEAGEAILRHVINLFTIMRSLDYSEWKFVVKSILGFLIFLTLYQNGTSGGNLITTFTNAFAITILLFLLMNVMFSQRITDQLVINLQQQINQLKQEQSELIKNQKLINTPTIPQQEHIVT